MTDRNQVSPNDRASTVTDVPARPCKRQTPFSGRGDPSKRIVNKFQEPAVLQLNIEGLTASKMSVLYHLAAQREALVILLQETHCTSAHKLVLPDYQLDGFSLTLELPRLPMGHRVFLYLQFPFRIKSFYKIYFT